MSDRRSFIRKVIYFCTIAVLLLPLSWLSAPATRGGPQTPGSAGGLLARMRTEHKLSQVNLGEIDPAGEAFRLATLGLNGVAANILWEKANHYKKTEDWTSLSATLEQIAKLQPNFISVWQFQGWNLSYNVSAEFDGYRERYYWVLRGIDFLKEGVKYNEDNPRLLWDIGWFISQKIGRADESKQFRRLFKADDDFHPADRPRQLRDNWLVGKEWYRRAERAVDDKKKSLQLRGKGKSELIFYADAPMCQINYSDAIEQEGTHSEVAREAWKKGGQEWHQYGNRPLLHSSGYRFRLNDRDGYAEESKRLREQLDALAPAVREQLHADHKANLPAAEKKALATPESELTQETFQAQMRAQQLLQVSDMDVAEQIAKIAPEKKAEALRLARALIKSDQEMRNIGHYQQIVNYDYWRTRCQFEQTPAALLARAKIYQGDQAANDANLVAAKRLYDEGFRLWRKVLDNFPSIVDDSITGDDLMDLVKRYRKILEEIDEPFPQDFPLRDIIKAHDTRGEFDQLLEPESKPESATVPES